MSGTKSELEAELALAEGWLREVGQRRDDLLQKLGRPVAGSGGRDFAQQVDATEATALAFEAMTPSERMRLYESDPERHAQLLDAVERQGWRRLLGGTTRW